MIRLYVLGEKGYNIIMSIPTEFNSIIDDVVIGRDINIENDFFIEIKEECKKRKLKFYERKQAIKCKSKYSIAISWKYIIDDGSITIIIHDSLLPRLRGFNPLVTALINGDTKIGATSIIAAEKFDRGEIINQISIRVEYPIKIQEAIKKINIIYLELFLDIVLKIKENRLTAIPQDEKKATYSLWRDENDYQIDWNKDALDIKRFIDSVGKPYKGAKTYLINKIIRIYHAEVARDIIIENRTPGKVIFKENDSFFIVCGKGILCIKDFYDDNHNIIGLNKNFRLRFNNFMKHPQ